MLTKELMMIILMIVKHQQEAKTVTHPIIQSIIDANKHNEIVHRAAYAAGYTAGKDMLEQVRRKIADLDIDKTLPVHEIYSDGWQDAMGEALAIIDKVIAATEGGKE